VAEELANKILSLPMYPELDEKAIRRIARSIRQYDAQPLWMQLLPSKQAQAPL
jgi:hypothetical protein